MEGKHIFAELGIIADLQMLVDKKWSVIEPIIHTFSFKKNLGEEIYNNIFDNVLNINRILNYQDAIIFFESVIRIFLKQNRNDYFKKVIFVSNLIKSKINFEGTFLFKPESPRNILNIFFNNYDIRRTLFDVKFLAEHLKPEDIGSSMINAFIEDLCKTKSYNVSVEKCEIIRAYTLHQILDLSYYLLRSYFPTPECIYYRHPEVDKLIEYGYFSILEELDIRKNEKLSMEMSPSINTMTYVQVTRRIELLNELNFKLHSSDFSLYIKNVTRHNDVYKYILYINFRDTFFFFDDEDFDILKRIKDVDFKSIGFRFKYTKIFFNIFNKVGAILNNNQKQFLRVFHDSPGDFYDIFYRFIIEDKEEFEGINYVLFELLIILSMREPMMTCVSYDKIDTIINVCLSHYNETTKTLFKLISPWNYVLSDTNGYEFIKKLDIIAEDPEMLEFILEIFVIYKSVLSKYYHCGYFTKLASFFDYPMDIVKINDMITEMPIVQPYFIPNNNEVFEKLSMTKWVIENGTNPMTGEEMSYTELVEHNNKKEILRKIIEKNKEIFPSIDTPEIENINKKLN